MPEAKTIRVVKAVCTKCKNDVTVDIGEMTIEEAKISVTKGMYSCSVGRHIELGPMSDYLKFDWSSLEAKVDDAPTDIEYGKELVGSHGQENVFYLGSEETGKAVGVPSLHTLNDLDHIGFGEFRSEGFLYSRHDSPLGGMRFYVRIRR